MKSFRAENIGDNDFLNRLTHRLTTQIREEVKKEIYDLGTTRENTVHSYNVTERIESYLQQELSSTHTCKICFELMTAPENTPILLFPCGHTFCKQCIEKHCRDANKRNKCCPYCRTPIESKAVNQALKDLIDQFVTQKLLSEKGRKLNDLFNCKKKGHHSSSDSDEDIDYSQYTYSTAVDAEKAAQRQLQKLKSCEIRFAILSSELQEISLKGQLLANRKKKISHATEHLQVERAKIEDKIQLLLEERDLLDRHLESQAAKQKELNELLSENEHNADMLRGTMTSLQRELDKIRLLVQGVREMDEKSN
eukprot:gene28313-37367_t